MEIPKDILFSALTGLVTFLVTFHTIRLKDRKRQKEGWKSLEKTLEKIFTALCRCNGFGEKFKAEFARIGEEEEEFKKGKNPTTSD